MATPAEELETTALPVILIEGVGEPLIYHIWQDVSIQRQMEMTDKPTVTGGRDEQIVRQLPPSFSFTVVCSDEVTVPIIKEGAVHQSDVSMIEQVQTLQGLIGQRVSVTSDKLDETVTGIVRNVETTDDGRFDNSTLVNVTVRSFARKETADGVVLGDTIFANIEVPVSTEDTGAESEFLEPGLPGLSPNFFNSLPGAGNCPVVKEPPNKIDSGLSLSPQGIAEGIGSAFKFTFKLIGEVNRRAEEQGAQGPLVRSAEKQSEKDAAKNIIRFHSNGDVFVDDNEIAPNEDIFVNILNDAGVSKDEFVDVTALPPITTQVMPPTDLPVGERGLTTLRKFNSSAFNLRDELIIEILANIPRQEGGTGLDLNPDTLVQRFREKGIIKPGEEALAVDTFRERPLPSDQYKIKNRPVFSKLPEELDTSTVAGIFARDHQLFAKPALLVLMSRNILSRFVNRNKPLFGEC